MLFFYMPKDIIVIKSFFLSIFFSKYSIEISKYSYFYKDLFTTTIVDNDIFYLSIPDDCSDDYFGWLFRITIPDDNFGWLFRMPVSEYFSGWQFRVLFQMTISNDYFGSSEVIDLQTRMKHQDWINEEAKWKRVLELSLFNSTTVS